MEGVVRLGPAQSRYLARRNPNPNLFNISILLESEQEIDDGYLTNAINLLVAKHDAFRLRIKNIDGDTQQTVLPPDKFSFELEKFRLTDLAATRPDELRQASDDIQLGLNLKDGPVFRAVLFESGEAWKRLLLVVHHMVSDRVSILLFLDELNEVYAQLLELSLIHI